MLKWALGLLGLGAAGYVAKGYLDKTPRVGDVATVPFAKLNTTGLPASALIPLKQLFAGGAGNATVTVTTAPNAGSVSAAAGAGIPVTLLVADILSLSRGGKVIF